MPECRRVDLAMQHGQAGGAVNAQIVCGGSKRLDEAVEEWVGGVGAEESNELSGQINSWKKYRICAVFKLSCKFG